MSLNGECPLCGARGPLVIFLTVVEAKQAISLVAQLPRQVGSLALYYLDLFRPASGRATALNKALRLLAELRDEVNRGHVQIKGRVARPCPPELWAAAIQNMLDRRASLTLPMPNHNYLKKIAWDLADAADRAREAQRLEAERGGSPPGVVTRGEQSPAPLDFTDLNERELAMLPKYVRQKHGME